MKTTLELPDSLFRQAKATALQRRTTLKCLFTQALERELRRERGASETGRFKVDEEGWPVLRRNDREKATVTDAFVEALRESEGV